MFAKRNRELDALETRLEHLEHASKRLLDDWEKAQLDLSDIKQQVLRTLNRLIAQERRSSKEKPSEDAPGDTNGDGGRINPLALGILQRRR